MKTAIIYNSENEENIKIILDAIQEKYPVDLYDAAGDRDYDLKGYDLIGIATDVRGSTVDKSIIKTLKNCLPVHKRTFVIYTARSANNHYIKPITECAKGKNVIVDGIYFCIGSYLSGFSKMFGGKKQSHPNQLELNGALKFYESLIS